MWFYSVLSIFGYTFAIKIMEKGEHSAHETYMHLATEVPEAERIALD
ncbi:MAG TPA: rubrerythrin family protein, partial [Firmicutes bacterium]|nr:rubrerythrin family protein [Bacillota bacterium]